MYSPPQNYIEKPINLLSFDGQGHAILSQQAIEFIQSIPKPISIMSIAGPYRTGKSYLLNSIISGEETFPVSSTTSSCTKGLWVWGKPLLSVDEQGKITNVLVIDTEGFGCIDEVYDKRIIILALLLSTCFIYNSIGNIDRSSLQDLEYVIEQTKKIKREVAFDSVTDFHWVLRDFHFQLVNQLELQIPSNQYMQKCLRQFAEQNEQQREAYKHFCNFFRNRNCHTFTSPQTDPNLQQNPQFLQQLIKFKKILNGIPSLDLQGCVLSEIMKAYVAAMNQDLGVEREGIQCRLRLNCISQLNRQLQTISEDKQGGEIREKKIKLALHDVDENYIAKMKSEKQIKILKDDINLLLSEYEQSNVSTITKHIKAKQSKTQIRVIRTKQIKIPVHQIQNGEEQIQIKNALKSQLVTAQRAREELQGKIYGYQLANRQLSQDLKRLNAQNIQLQEQTKQLQEKFNDINDQLSSKEKKNTIQKMELNQIIQSIKKQKLIACSTLEKQKKLLQEKIGFLQERFACMQLQKMEKNQGKNIRYAQKIQYLEKQNNQMSQKHRKEIQELKKIYLYRDDKMEVSQKQLTSYRKIEMGEEIKTYLQCISKLEEENSKLIIEKTQLENLKFESKSMYEQLKVSSTAEIESLQKQLRQNKANLSQMHSSQMSLKNLIIKEYESKLQEETKFLKTEVELLTKKNEEQNNETNEAIASLQQALDKAEEEIVSTCEQLQISQNKRIEKEYEIKELLEKIQQQQTLFSKNKSYSSNTTEKKFYEESELQLQIEELKQKLETMAKKNHELEELQHQIRKQLLEEREQYNQHNEQRKSMYEIQLIRLQQKIVTLTNSNSNLKQIQKEYEKYRTMMQQRTQQQKQLVDVIEDKDRNIKNISNQYTYLKQQNIKLQKIIGQLTKSIKINHQELSEISDKTNEKLEQKEMKYLEILQKYYEKQKKYQILKQHYRNNQQYLQNKDKQLRKQIYEKLGDKNKQIYQLKKDLQEESTKSNDFKVQALKSKQQLELSNQRFVLIEEGYQRKVEETKQECQRQMQKLNIKINNLETVIKKLQENKVQIQKSLNMYQNDARETCSTITLMRSKYDKHCQQYQANMKTMRKRIAQLERQNMELTTKIQKYDHELQYLRKNKELLEDNYNEDFKLWSSKIRTMQEIRSISR